MANEPKVDERMNTAAVYSRREVIHRGGSAVALGTLATLFGATLPRRAGATADAQNPRGFTILYPGGRGIKFAPDYYRDHHLKLFMRLYGDSVKRFELRTVTAAGTRASAVSAPVFSAAINIWLTDLDAFNARTTEAGMKQMSEDKRNFTNTQSMVQIDEVYGQMGEPPSDANIGDTCLTRLYANNEGVRWDVDHYRTVHMPLMMRLYGEDAIKRLELRKGVSDFSGGKPSYVGAVNMYINNRAAFDAADAAHSKALLGDAARFSNVGPIEFTSTIYGIG